MKEFFTYLNKLNALEDAPFDLDSQWESKPKNESKRIVKKSAKLNENYGHDGYMYITKHGLGPGTLPKDAHLLKWRDLPHYMTAIWLDRFLTTDELNQYDIYPETQIKRVMDMYDITEDDIMGESVKAKCKTGSKALKEELSDIKQEWEDFLSDGGNNVIEFDDGDYVFVGVDFDKGTIYAGSATNTGIIREYEINLDSDLNLDENIAELYDEIYREKEQKNDAWYEEHKDDIENAWEEQATSDVQSELDAEHLGESAKPKRKFSLKENKRLVEGPGAGYSIEGQLTNIHINNFTYDVVNKVGSNVVVIDCDIDAVSEDTEAYSYYYGDKIGNVPVKITNVEYYLENEEDIPKKSEVAEDLKFYLDGCYYSANIGGGWTHETFYGKITAGEIRHYNHEFSPLRYIEMECTDEGDILYIDDVVTGEYEREDEEDEIDESMSINEDNRTKKINLYVNGEYICSSHKYARAKDLIDAVKRDGKVVYAGVNKDGKLSDKVVFEIKDTDKVTARIVTEAVETDKSLEDNGLTKTTLKAIKKGTYFTFKPVEDPSENIVYVKDEYDRESRKYGYYKWSDVNNWHEKKGDTVVYTGFTF